MEAKARLAGWSGRFYALHLWSVVALFFSNLFLALAVLADLWDRRTPPRAASAWGKTPHVRVPFFLYIAILVLSIAASYDPRWSLREAGELFSLATLPLAFVLVRSRRQIRLLIDGFCAVASVGALWGISQLLTGYGDLHHRIRGPFSHYMTFAGVLLIADVLLISNLVSRPLSWKNWRWPALVLVNLGLVGSLTRSAWVALVVTLLVLALMRAPKSLLVFIPLGVLLIALAPPTIKGRVLSIGDLRNVTNYDRLCMTEAGLHMIRERPLFGLGPKMVRERYPIYRPPSSPRETVQHLHNTYLQLAAERGLPALGVYLWLILAAMVAAYRGYRHERRRERDDDEENGNRGNTAGLYLGVFLSLLAFSLAGLFEANWADTEIQRIVLFLLAVPYLLRETETSTGAG